MVGCIRSTDDRHVAEYVVRWLLVEAVTVQILTGGGVAVADDIHSNSYNSSSSVVANDGGQFAVVVQGGSVVVCEVINEGHGGSV